MKPSRMKTTHRIIPTAILTCLCAAATHSRAQGIADEPQKPTQYIEVKVEQPRLALFQGFSLAIDAISPALYLLSDFGGAEAALRLNLKNTYFPTVELGYAKGEQTDENTAIQYKTGAPFLRAGIDLNMLKNKFQNNRLYVGARYGFSSYSYDMSGPEITDPVWGGSEPFAYHDMDARSHWMELIFGVQTRLWATFHLGWNIRYKRELSTTKNLYAKPTYIPGYGKTTHSAVWSGNFYLIFDLNWGKSSHRRATSAAPQVRVTLQNEARPDSTARPATGPTPIIPPQN